MVFPIGDDNSARQRFPFVTYALIAINAVVFLLQLQDGQNFLLHWAFIPANFAQDPAGNAGTLISAMFMHGGWLHLFGNMLYLYIFGDNIEDELGHVPFLLFYLAAGLAATLAQFAYMPGSAIPNVGASGAIAGVLGAYLVRFPHGRVKVLMRGGIVEVPALVALGLWIVIQFVSFGGELAAADAGQTGGVAYMAHIGGFVAGVAAGLIARMRAA
jgi:membrane associated rhomboid family serine protease